MESLDVFVVLGVVRSFLNTDRKLLYSFLSVFSFYVVFAGIV